MAWIYLFSAAVFEIGWPLGFKLSHVSEHKLLWVIFSIVSMTLSGALLYIAQKDINIGTAYAVWTGIGALGTFLIGALVFKDPATFLSWLGLLFIVGGVTLLKISH